MEQLMQNTIQPILTALVTAVIAALGALALKWIKTKTGIEISQDLAASAESAATKAVLAVEEKAAADAAAGAAKWASRQKYAAAIDLVVRAVPSVTPEQAGTLVNAALAKIPALGASGDMNKTPTPSAQ